jgi:pimeloyl-ACP methyl ester carboxylesterase
MYSMSYRKVEVEGFNVFYREAGPQDAPAILLLHGFPSASHMFRDLIPLLAEHFHVIAPDLLGFGQSDMPDRGRFTYTFDDVSRVVDRFTGIVGLARFAIYVFDYGAPTGFRLATWHPERVSAIISQNGNAYVEGLSDGWTPIRTYWEDPSQANRDALRAFLAPETTIWQYTHGVADPAGVSPDGYSLDNFYLARPDAHEVQLDLFGDYKSNVALYPEFQTYFRTISRASSRPGERTTRFFFRPAPKHSGAIYRTPWCGFSTPVTSHSKRTPSRSLRRSANSSPPDIGADDHGRSPPDRLRRQ